MKFIVVQLLLTLMLFTTSLEAQSIFDRKKSIGRLSHGKDTITLSELVEDPIRLKTTSATAVAVFRDPQLRSRIGIMNAGTPVTLIALGKQNQFKVRGKAQHAGVAGWLRSKDLVCPDKELIKKLRRMHERKLLVNQLIAEKEVALGMTSDEVVESIGKPTHKKSKITKEGVSGSYEYVTYEKVPQYTNARNQFGQIYRTVTYMKIPTGRLSVQFKNSVVSSIEETEGNPLGDTRVTTIPIPIDCNWW